MEYSVVLFKLRIHLFACTHPSVSISCDCNAFFEYKHQSVALIQTCLVCGSLFCVQASVCSPHSNMFGLWFLVLCRRLSWERSEGPIGVGRTREGCPGSGAVVNGRP